MTDPTALANLLESALLNGSPVLGPALSVDPETGEYDREQKRARAVIDALRSSGERVFELDAERDALRSLLKRERDALRDKYPAALVRAEKAERELKRLRDAWACLLAAIGEE